MTNDGRDAATATDPEPGADPGAGEPAAGTAPEEAAAPRMRPLGATGPDAGERREGRVIRITLPSWRLPRGRTAVTAALAAVALVATVAAVVFGWLLWDRTGTDEAGTEALATARAFATTVTTYDHRTLGRDFAAVLDGATGEFRTQYSGASTALRRLITDAKAEAHGQVVGAGVQSATPDRVEAVLLVDQSITNASTPQPRIDRTRIVMTLSRHDGRWLVERLELV